MKVMFFNEVMGWTKMSSYNTKIVNFCSNL